MSSKNIFVQHLLHFLRYFNDWFKALILMLFCINLWSLLYCDIFVYINHILMIFCILKFYNFYPYIYTYTVLRREIWVIFYDSLKCCSEIQSSIIPDFSVFFHENCSNLFFVLLTFHASVWAKLYVMFLNALQFSGLFLRYTT